MVKHIVMWRMKEAQGRTARENAAFIKGQLEQLPSLIPQLKHLEAHLDAGETGENCDLVLITHTEDFAALTAYQNHPAHQKVGEYVKKVSAQRSCVDFIME